jgi:hypothetical protein
MTADAKYAEAITGGDVRLVLTFRVGADGRPIPR